MEKLTRKQKLELCIKAKEMYERNKGQMGLCEIFTTCYNRSVRFEDWIVQSRIFEYIPELLECKPKHLSVKDFWWNPFEISPRMRAINYLIKRFSE